MSYRCLSFALPFFLVSMAFSQLKTENGRFYPKGYQILTEQSASSLGKTTLDTLHYKTLEKVKQDFIVNSGCGDYGTDQGNINVARDDNGGYMCVWSDGRTGIRQVMNRRYAGEAASLFCCLAFVVAARVHAIYSEPTLYERTSV